MSSLRESLRALPGLSELGVALGSSVKRSGALIPNRSPRQRTAGTLADGVDGPPGAKVRLAACIGNTPLGIVPPIHGR